MSRWVDSAREWVARFRGGPATSAGPLAGDPVTADGLSAVLAVEGLMGTTPLAQGTPRRALAQAAGQALGGLRVSAHLDGPDLLAAHHRLAWASGRGLPMVVQATLGAAQGHATAAGTGHDGWHAVAGAGCFQLIARDVQEAVDLTVVARAVAEAALVPGLVGMDRDQTAMAIQKVCLPPVQLLDALVGQADDQLESQTDSQRTLFGATRRRVPAWFDLARPALLGGTQGPEAYGLGAAARRPLVLKPLVEILASTMRQLSAQTGRPLGMISVDGVEDADLVLVAQGSLAQVLQSVATHLRSTDRRSADRLRVGVVAVTALRPFPLADLRQALAGKQHVVAFERVDAPLAADGPLAAELRAALQPGARLQSVACGLGGLPVRAADVALFCRSAAGLERDHLYLGLDFLPASSRYPRRQAALDMLRRDHPELQGLGLRAASDQPLDVRPVGSVTVEIVRSAGRLGLPSAVAHTLQHAGLAQVRARPADEWLDESMPRVDRVSFGPDQLRDGGDVLPAEIAVLCPPFAEPGARPFAQLGDAGAVLILAPGDDDAVLGALPSGLRADLTRLGLETWALDPVSGLKDSLVGGLSALLRRRELLQLSDSTLTGAHKRSLTQDTTLDGHMASFSAALTGLRQVTLPAPEVAVAPPLPRPPLAVRHLDEGTGGLDDVAGFWNHVGVLYAQGHTDELAPDAMLAAGAIPPLSATFRDLTPTRTEFPALDPSLCTGCARCWSSCPDGSIAAATLTPRALLDAGVALAIQQGGAAGGLRPIAGKVAAQLAKQAASGSAGAQLVAAVDSVLAKAKLPADRLAAAEAARDAVGAVLGDLPLSRTTPFYDEAPAGERELLLVAFDTETCKACRSCWAVCPTGAITPQPHTEERIAHARSTWRLWEQLPDTAGETIHRVLDRNDVDPVGALLMSRHALLAMAGADAAEPGSGERLALRLVLGVAEARLQPQLQRLVAQATDLASQTSERVRETLASVMPVDDIDALSQGMAGMGRHQVDVAQLLSRAGQAGGSDSTLSASQAQSLADLLAMTRDLQDLSQRLARGSIGLGRARLGIVMGPGPAAWWGALFPYNPFQVPVVDDGGLDSTALAQGLLDAQLHSAIVDLDLLRRARALIAGRGDVPRVTGWADLDADERLACPPIILVGDDRLLASGGLDSLLATGLPVRVLVLSDADLLAAPSQETTLLTVGHSRGAYVLQSSLGAPRHLAEGLTAALAHDGAALIRIHSPSPRRHGLATHQALASSELAVRSRAWPLLRLDPTRPGVFGSQLDLDGNPAGDQERAPSATGDGLLAPIDWAKTEQRFATVDHQRLSQASASRLSTWRVLQELAGIVTPFTDRVRAAAAADVLAEHAAALSAKDAQHAAELAGQRAQVEAQLALRVRDRLLQMSGYPARGEG